MVFAGPGRHFHDPNRLCQTHFQFDAGYCQSALYGPDGFFHGSRRLYLRRDRAGADQRSGHHCVHRNGRGSDPADYYDDSAGLELFQAIAGDRRALCTGWGALLHLAPGLLHGGLEGYIPGIPVLVPDGRLPAAFAGAQRLVPPGFQLFCGSVYRQRRRTHHRAGQHLPVAVLRIGAAEDRTEM